MRRPTNPPWWYIVLGTAIAAAVSAVIMFWWNDESWPEAAVFGAFMFVLIMLTNFLPSARRKRAQSR